MKAILYSQYGLPDQLQLHETEKPVPKKGEVLIRVISTSLNSWDLDMLRGNSWIIRLISGLFKPKYKILGADIAGIVEAVGEHVFDFKIGDEVFGDIAGSGFGGFAEYVSVPEKLLARKSPFLTFNQAAALPQAGLLALQGLRYHGEVQPGQQILINGAGGGVGTLAVQYCKLLGSTVTCVDKSQKFKVLRSLGADHLIDFTTTDYTKTKQQYDKILDVIAHRSAGDYRRALKSNGVFAMIGGSMGWLLLRMIALEPLLSKFNIKKLGIMGYHPNRTDLDLLSRLAEEKKVVPIIDQTFNLPQTADAFRHFISGSFIGKIVIEVHPEESQKTLIPQE